jgi:hypothetical protein
MLAAAHLNRMEDHAGHLQGLRAHRPSAFTVGLKAGEMGDNW